MMGNYGATTHGACLRRVCVLVRNSVGWTRCPLVVLRGLDCIWGALVCFLFVFCIFGMPENSQCYSSAVVKLKHELALRGTTTKGKKKDLCER